MPQVSLLATIVGALAGFVLGGLWYGPLFGKGTVRADGRKVHPAYLVEVKKPSDSKGPYDYYKVRATIPADQAFRPMAEGGCPLVAAK